MADLLSSQHATSWSHDVCDVCEQIFPVDERDEHPCWIAWRVVIPAVEQLAIRKERARRDRKYVRAFLVATDVLEQILEAMGPRVFWARHEVGAHYEYPVDEDGYEDDYAEPTVTYDEGAHSSIALRLDHVDVVHRPAFPAGGVRLEFWPAMGRETRETLTRSTEILKQLYQQGPISEAFFDINRAGEPQRLAGYRIRDDNELRDRLDEAARRIDQAYQSITLANPRDIVQFEKGMGIRVVADPNVPQGHAYLVPQHERLTARQAFENAVLKIAGIDRETGTIVASGRSSGQYNVQLERVPPWALRLDEHIPMPSKPWRTRRDRNTQENGSGFNGTPRNLRVHKRRGER